MKKAIFLLVASLTFCAWAQEPSVLPMTKAEIYKTLAERSGLSKDQVKTALDELAKLAYQEAPRGFTIPDIGKLVVVDRAARTGRNPATGETIQIPAKKAVKFRIAKACKDAVLGATTTPGATP